MKMIETRYASPTADLTFKLVFGEDQHKQLTIDFLNDLLERPEGKLIKEITFINRENTPRNLLDKRTFLDISCKDQSGARFIIEMQTGPESYFDKRALYYTANLLARQLENTDPYTELKPVIFIGILTYNLYKTHNNVVSHHLICDMNTGKQSLDLVELHFVELSKFDKKADQLESKIDKWLFYLKSATTVKEIPAAYKDSPSMQQAFDIVERTKWSSERIEKYEREIEFARKNLTQELVVLEELKEARKEGRQEGVQKEKEVIAMSLLQEGLDVDLIAKATKLTIDQIEALRKKK